MDARELTENIMMSLSELKPFKVILFGSSAYGEPHADSDIDLVVVLNKTGFPLSYSEKMKNHRIVRKLLRDMNRSVPIDVIVFTIDEWNAFIETGSYFSKMIVEKGKAIA